MAKKFRIGKIDFKKRAMNTAIGLAVGAGSKVIATMIEGDPDPANKDIPKNADTVSIGMAIVGAVLPEIVKAPEADAAAQSLLGVAAYRYAEHHDLPGALSLNGLTDHTNIGQSRTGWAPQFKEYQPKSNPAKEMSNVG